MNSYQLDNFKNGSLKKATLFMRNKELRPILIFTAMLMLYNFSSAQLTVSSGANVFIGSGATVSVQGNLSNSGSITGAGLTLLNGWAQQNIDGIGDITNLTLNNPAGAVISSGAANNQSIYGTLIIANGNLATNDNLTIKSTVAGTASVGNSAGTITGFASVERYIASPGQRAWHLLSTNTYASGQTIKQAWQENSGPIVAGVGTLVTSNLYNGSNGFDMVSISSSILMHNQGGLSGPSWNYNLANTNATTWSSFPGYMLFVRGDRNYTPQNIPATSSTMIRSKGSLYQGTQTAIVVSATGTGRTLVGNPFASGIDLENIFVPATTLDQNFYIWDPSLTGNFGVGAFRVVQRNGVGSYTATPSLGVSNDNTLRYIQSGQAFFLKATGSNANVVFNEDSKTGYISFINPIISIQGDQQIIANLMIINPGNIESLADGIRLRFDDSYNADLSDDIEKMGNFAENISSYRLGKKLIVEQRPMIVTADTIFLRFTNAGVKDYRFKINTQDFVQPNVTAWLQDTWLNTNTVIDLSGAVKDFDFSVTSDPASANIDRFRIVFSLSGPLPVTFTSIKAYQVSLLTSQPGNNISVEWKVSNQVNIDHYEIEKSTDGTNFSKVGMQTATGINGSDAAYTWLDVNAVTGNNFYRIRSVGIGNEIKYSVIVKVTITKGVPAIIVYPNPVINRSVTFKFTDMPKGIYQLRLINSIGQVMMISRINHSGGNTIQMMGIDKNIANGTYQLEIRQPDNTLITKGLVIADQ
ncbi:MAG: hypothetical protein ABI685_11700 [Ferruginibacter sp.]